MTALPIIAPVVDHGVTLRRGQVIEHGRHDELMALGGTYHELFTLQARAYADTVAP